MWPFRRSAPEKREAPYTDAIIAQILAGAEGETAADTSLAAAAVAASSFLGRCLATATVAPEAASSAFPPGTLYEMGCALAVRGEWLGAIEVNNTIELLPGASWSVVGGVEESGWRYSVEVAGPSGQATRQLPSEAVFHPRINIHPARPHIGQGLIRKSVFGAMALANIERALAREAGSPSGHVIPAPMDIIGEETLAALKNDLANIKGRSTLVPSMTAGWGEGQRTGSGDWKPQRIGADPSEGQLKLHESGTLAVLTMCGVPPSLFAANANANAVREGMRTFLHSTLKPIARIIQHEARAKLLPGIEFDFTNLFASDLVGRARAFQSMVGGGMEIERAAALSGLLTPEEGD